VLPGTALRGMGVSILISYNGNSGTKFAKSLSFISGRIPDFLAGEPLREMQRFLQG
jgi:hypothetical protein